MAILGFRDAADALFPRHRGGPDSPFPLRMLRKTLTADGAHRLRSVRARATTGGAEKVRSRLGGLPGPPRAVPHFPAGGAGAVRSRREPDGQQGRHRGRGGVRRLPAALPRGPEGPGRPAHEGRPALPAGPVAGEGSGEDPGGDQGVHAVPREGAGHPPRAGSLREDPRAAKPAGPARGGRGAALPQQEAIRKRRGAGPFGGRDVPRRAGLHDAPRPARSVARKTGEEGRCGDLPEDAGGEIFRSRGAEAGCRIGPRRGISDEVGVPGPPRPVRDHPPAAVRRIQGDRRRRGVDARARPGDSVSEQDSATTSPTSSPCTSTGHGPGRTTMRRSPRPTAAGFPPARQRSAGSWTPPRSPST